MATIRLLYLFIFVFERTENQNEVSTRVPWRLVHPRLVLVTIRPTRLVLVTIGLLNFSTHIFLVPVSFSPRIFRQPLGAGGLIVTCDSWSTLLWQLVHPSYIVNLGTNVTRSRVTDDSYFFSWFFWKFQGMSTMAKTEFTFFCFSVKWKTTKILAIKYFFVFLAVHVCLTSEDYQIFTVHRIEHREFESAEIFCLSFFIFEIEVFYVFFNSAQQQCNDLCWKKKSFHAIK
jgi:hypothetical protein